MSTNKTHDIPAGLEGVRRRFEHWRGAHKARSRIPVGLWATAVRAAGSYGLHRTSKILRLDYYSLKERVGQQSAAALVPPKRIAATTFLELAPVTSSGFAMATVDGCECTLEMENSGGAKMRVHLKGNQVPDLAALSRSFWNPAS